MDISSWKREALKVFPVLLFSLLLRSPSLRMRSPLNSIVPSLYRFPSSKGMVMEMVFPSGETLMSGMPTLLLTYPLS